MKYISTIIISWLLVTTGNISATVMPLKDTTAVESVSFDFNGRLPAGLHDDLTEGIK